LRVAISHQLSAIGESAAPPAAARRFPRPVPPGQFRTPLFDALVALAEQRKVSFHTPGHKSGKGISTRFRRFVGNKIFTIDLTTLDEVDCLQRPVGVIREAQDLAAEAYGADRSFFLVNGTTVGNHTMVAGVLGPGDEVLVARNAHKSILTGVILCGAIPRFFLPEVDPELGIALNVTAEAARRAMAAHPRARAIVLTSPNYYGVAANLAPIVAEAHARGLAVLVDEAHGPHLRFHPALPLSALEAGADLCVQSTHKIIGGMTQASMLHLQGPRVDAGRVAGMLHLLQSTSPSYILMASLDLARMQMATEGEQLLGRAVGLAASARERLDRLPGVRCFGVEALAPRGDFGLDGTKLTIGVRDLGLTGFEASAALNAEFDIQVEMADLWNVLVIVSIGDRRDDLDRLVGALAAVAARPRAGAGAPEVPIQDSLVVNRLALAPREAFFRPSGLVPLGEAAGEVSADIVTIYPPGIPLLVPGEVIPPEAVEYLRSQAAHGARVDGLREEDPPRLRVVAG
jgi:arginine/lysine/ornithine decarboxylase